jgi:hypothetical protein
MERGTERYARPFEPQTQVKVCICGQLVTINAHKIAPMTHQRLQERTRDSTRRAYRMAAEHDRGWRMCTRWTTALPSKVNLPHAICFRAACGSKSVT